jgi:hypothetical protein
MTTQALAAALVLAFSCVLEASCAQGPSPVGAGGGAPVVETQDDDDFGSDPDVGVGVGSDPAGGELGSSAPTSTSNYPNEASAGEDDPLRLTLCLSLAPASISRKVAFCDSLPRANMQARCMSHRWNRVEWTDWCYFEFTE